MQCSNSCRSSYCRFFQSGSAAASQLLSERQCGKKTCHPWIKTCKKHSNELRALKEIHKIQSSFLEKFDGKTSRVSQQERSNLQILLEHLPSAAKSSDMPYADKMLDAAASTYLASLLTSLVYFLRFAIWVLMLFGGRRRR